jgi:hypothetical protein
MTLQLAGYVALIAIAVWLYLGLFDDAHWLGASTAVYAVMLLCLAVSTSAPYLVTNLGAPALLAASLAVAPTLLMFVSFRWLVRSTGGPRIEIQVFDAFRRINRIGEGQPMGARKHPGDNERLTQELDDLRNLRTHSTARLIDALDVINRSWIASEIVPPAENNARLTELSNAADELWGADWRKRK